VAVVSAYAVGVAVFLWRGRRDGRPLADLLDLSLVAVLGGLLGAKVFHTVFEARGHVLTDGTSARGAVDLLRDDPWHWARFFEAGHVFYGGALVGGAALWLLATRRAVPVKAALFDAAVPGVLAGVLIGRVGCFLAGCCYGAALPPGSTLAAIGVRFPPDHPTHGALVHPVELYDAAFGAVGLAVLGVRALVQAPSSVAWGGFPGGAACVAAAAYAVHRFATEVWRADVDRGLWLGGALSTAQIVSLVVFPVAVVLWWTLRRRSRPFSESP
jgi:phosphatidylglycerol:prolipoprotein diacylglycerol transferase